MTLTWQSSSARICDAANFLIMFCSCVFLCASLALSSAKFISTEVQGPGKFTSAINSKQEEIISGHQKWSEMVRRETVRTGNVQFLIDSRLRMALREVDQPEFACISFLAHTNYVELVQLDAGHPAHVSNVINAIKLRKQDVWSQLKRNGNEQAEINEKDVQSRVRRPRWSRMHSINIRHNSTCFRWIE